MEEFPEVNPEYSLIKIPGFDTFIHGKGTPKEQRIIRNPYPQWAFKIHWDVLSKTDCDLIMDFFVDRKGMGEAFYFANVEEAYAVNPWEASTAYALGKIYRPTTANRRSYIVTSAGTSAGSEPTWPTTPNGTVVDGGVTWQENSYITRFDTDTINIEYFQYMLYRIHEITLLQVDG